MFNIQVVTKYLLSIWSYLKKILFIQIFLYNYVFKNLLNIDSYKIK